MRIVATEKFTPSEDDPQFVLESQESLDMEPVPVSQVYFFVSNGQRMNALTILLSSYL